MSMNHKNNRNRTSNSNNHNNNTNTRLSSSSNQNSHQNSHQTIEMKVQSLQIKAKDIEQRLTSALEQQLQMMSVLSTSKSSNSTKNSNKKQQQVQHEQLEQQLLVLSQHINRYRMVLCEIYSDWILYDTTSAHQYNCMNLLWKFCFYHRIAPARTRIQKDEKKLKSLIAKQNDDTNTNKTSEKDISTTLSNVLQQQKVSLNLFLKEGITLYEYLCHTLLLDQLVLITSKQSNDITTNINTKNQMIVPCLYRLYIHLGDLYRYGCCGEDTDTNSNTNQENQNDPMKDAEIYYQKASYIGPAYGHAYNQLAVIYQMKDMTTTSNNTSNTKNNASAITVYWYTRSLGATQEPFITSSSNLIRLFDTNRQWLVSIQQEQQQQNTPIMILQRPNSLSTTTMMTTTNHNNNDTKHKNNHMNLKNSSQFCLASFIDIQYTFYKIGTNTNTTTASLKSDDDHTNHKVYISFVQIDQYTKLYQQINDTIASIYELLKNSSLSDSLLCKLITIVSFMEYNYYYNTKNNQKEKKHDTNNNNNNNNNSNYNEYTYIASLVSRIIRTMIYEFGTCLADRVVSIITDKIKKQQQQQSVKRKSTSIRVLFPLLLTMEYLLQDNELNCSLRSVQQQQQHQSVTTTTTSTMIEQNNIDDNLINERYYDSYTKFWKTMIQVYNAIQSLDIVKDQNNRIDTSQHQRTDIPREYQEFRGFAPFESFLHKACIENTYLTGLGYVSDHVAINMIDILARNKNSPSQQQESLSLPKTGSIGNSSTNVSVSSSTTKSSNLDHDSILIKLRRFTSLRTTLTSCPVLKSHVRVQSIDDTLTWVESNNNGDDHDINNIEYDYNPDTSMQYNDNDDGGDCIVLSTMNIENDDIIGNMINSHNRTLNTDVLMYQNNENNGPALLVPGDAFILQEPQATKTAKISLMDSISHTTAMQHDPGSMSNHTGIANVMDTNTNSSNLSTTIGPKITPPPGFASNNQEDTFVTNFITPGWMSYNDNIHHNNTNTNHWQYQNPTTSLSSYGTTDNTTRTIGESMLFFGGSSALQTSNPFAATTNAGTGTTSTAFSNSRLFDSVTMEPSSLEDMYQPSFLLNNYNDTIGSDDSSLFSSGLLKNLLMKETSTGRQSKTDNPFS
jgi:hypothetical protein